VDGREWRAKCAVAVLLLGLALMGLSIAQDAGPLLNNPNYKDPPLNLENVFGHASTKVLGNCGQGLKSAQDWFPLSLLAIGMGIAISATGYAASGLLGTPQYMAFAKNTLWGVIEGAVILGVFSATWVGLEKFGQKNIDTARTYSSIIKNTAVYDFGMAVTASTLFTFFAKQAPQIRFPGLEGWYFGFQIYPMFRPIFDALGMVTQLMTVAIAEWTAHEFLLCFIKTTMVTLLIPAGIFLRIVGIRNGANALIGIALALYFVYPWLMIMIGEALNDYFTREIQVAKFEPDPNAPAPETEMGCLDTPICCIPPGAASPTDPNEYYIMNGLTEKVSQTKVLEGEEILPYNLGNAKVYCVYSTGLGRAYHTLLWALDTLGMTSLLAIPAAGAIATIAEYFNVSFMFIMLITPFMIFTLQAVYEMVFFLFIVSLILPIFSIFVTITIAKEFAKLLGTEIDLSAIEKII
jgi:hypothetical protein